MAEKIKNYFKNFKFTFDFALKCLAGIVLVVYVVLMAAGSRIFQPMNVFWRSLNFFGKAGEFNAVVRIVSYIVFFFGASWIIRTALKALAKPLKKGKAIVDILCSLIKYAAILVLLFFVLKTCG